MANRMPPRHSLRLLVGLLLAAGACTAAPADPEAGPATSAPTAGPTPETTTVEVPERMEEVACGLPEEWLVRIARGYHPERSAELQILPKEPHFVGAGLPHVGPWDYTSDVLMFFYGPGHIKPLGRVQRPATLADLAPTWARLLGFPFETPDGKPLTEALVPPEDRDGPPRLLVTVIWDGAGRNVLAEWEERWPNIRELIPEGAWYEHATAGSSPTSSAQGHAIIGTGTFPRTHGIVGHSYRVDGEIVSPWRQGPRHFLVPALADLWLEEHGDRAQVGILGTVAIQVGMIGHGSAWKDNPKPLAILREAPDAETLGAEGVRWTLSDTMREFYRFPEYANELPLLREYFGEWDRRDGMVDGTWRGHALDDEVIQGGFQTPARIPYQTRLLEEVLQRERFGHSEEPDLLYVNYKLIDQIGHIFSLNSEEMGDSVEAQDEYLPVLIDLLNREVGEGEWAMVITADHGSTPSPDVSGAFQISAGKLHEAIQREFDGDDDDVRVAEQVKQTEIFIDTDELAEHGGTLEDVAEFVMGLTQDDLYIPDVSNVSDPEERVFQAAFPAWIIPHLSCLPEDLRDDPA
jgi:hypothetical protein